MLNATLDPLRDFLLSATKHKKDCGRIFKKYDRTCPRCQELILGAQARPGWQGPHFAAKADRIRKDIDAIREHFAPGGRHDRGECGPVCTFGDW